MPVWSELKRAKLKPGLRRAHTHKDHSEAMLAGRPPALGRQRADIRSGADVFRDSRKSAAWMKIQSVSWAAIISRMCSQEFLVWPSSVKNHSILRWKTRNGNKLTKNEPHPLLAFICTCCLCCFSIWMTKGTAQISNFPNTQSRSYCEWLIHAC